MANGPKYSRSCCSCQCNRQCFSPGLFEALTLQRPSRQCRVSHFFLSHTRLIFLSPLVVHPSAVLDLPPLWAGDRRRVCLPLDPRLPPNPRQWAWRRWEWRKSKSETNSRQEAPEASAAPGAASAGGDRKRRQCKWERQWEELGSGDGNAGMNGRINITHV